MEPAGTRIRVQQPAQSAPSSDGRHSERCPQPFRYLDNLAVAMRSIIDASTIDNLGLEPFDLLGEFKWLHAILRVRCKVIRIKERLPDEPLVIVPCMSTM